MGSLRQRGNAFFPNPPHVIETKPLDYIQVVVNALLHEFSVKPDFVVPICSGSIVSSRIKLRNRFCGFRAKPS